MSRLLGTHAFDKQIQKGLGIEIVTVEMFNLGMLIESRRGIDKVMEVYNMNEFFDIFGNYSHNYASAYVLTSFFDQITTCPVKGYIKRFVPDDAVASSVTLKDTETVPVNTLRLDAGRRNYIDKGTWGDNVGHEIAHSTKSSTFTASAGTATDTWVEVLSVAGFEVGDIIHIDSTTDLYRKITSIDETLKRLNFETATGEIVPATSPVETLNFDILVYFKNDNGLVEKVEEWTYLTMEDECSNFVEKLINDEFKGSKYIKVTDLDSGSAIEKTRPAETTAIEYLTSGDNGTSPSDSDWETQLAEFDNLPVRLLANAESQTDSVNLSGEEYCRGRGNCLWIAAGDVDMTYDEARIWGASLLRSSQNYSMGDMQWFEVEDPIGQGDNPVIQIPAVGITSGYAFQEIYDKGFHKNPAGLVRSVAGVRKIVMDDTTEKDVMDDKKRTELADLGVNVFQYQKGRGFVRRSARMFSTDKKFRYFAGMFMKAIIKESIKLSIEIAEMEALGWEWLKEIRIAVRAYMQGLYKSSTNNGTESAFYIGFKTDGSPTTFEDVVQIIADSSNNTNSSLLDGEANVDVGFIPPPPAESIFIGVGINIMKKEA